MADNTNPKEHQHHSNASSSSSGRSSGSTSTSASRLPPAALPSHHFKDQAFADYSKSSNDDDGEITPRPPANIDFDAVTPGIGPDSYFPQQDDLRNNNTNSPEAQRSYFSYGDRKILQRQDSIWDRIIGHRSTMARRESLSEIRAANPALSLSGNVISATFNIPHAFTYCKGGHWVSTTAILSRIHLRLCRNTGRHCPLKHSTLLTTPSLCDI